MPLFGIVQACLRLAYWYSGFDHFCLLTWHFVLPLIFLCFGLFTLDCLLDYVFALASLECLPWSDLHGLYIHYEIAYWFGTAACVFKYVFCEFSLPWNPSEKYSHKNKFLQVKLLILINKCSFVSVIQLKTNIWYRLIAFIVSYFKLLFVIFLWLWFTASENSQFNFFGKFAYNMIFIPVHFISYLNDMIMFFYKVYRPDFTM